VLIGQTYLGFGDHEQARAHLRAALKQDPRVRRAHYYLGMSAVLAEGPAGLDEAAPEFREELKLAPSDVLTHLNLGAALVEGRRYPEALPHLERAARADPPRADALTYLGRCQLALNQPGQAVASLSRAVELARAQGATEAQLASVQYQLGVALRTLGRPEEAAPHFAAAERHLGERADESRVRMARYLADVPDPQAGPAAAASLLDTPPLGELTPAQRKALRGRVTSALARANLNLGILEARARRFAEAAELFEEASRVDPGFPQVQYSLGVARFNAQQYDKAVEPLSRALAASGQDADLRRMLALASLETRAYAKAADLLKDDPQRERDPSLQYAFAMALVRSDRAAEATPLFSRLIKEHEDSAELSVLLGQAYAQQGDFPAAIEALTRALKLKADVAEANATLGEIYLRQGRLDEAEQALRGELKARPDDARSQLNLAITLDAQHRPEEALPLLRRLAASKPEGGDAHYLLGKVLLGQGAAEEALSHLEEAARLSPEDANVRYQLGQAYQKLGKPEKASEQFEIFRQLKEKRRGSSQ
jgi:tetratricopeptide (TPR) repeat protein